MVRMTLRSCLLVALGLAAAVTISANVGNTAEDKVPDLHTIMSKSFNKKTGYKGAVETAVKGENWEEAQKVTKEWNDLAVAIAKNKPTKGEQKSWDEYCAKFTDNMKTIVDATDKKDAKAANKALNSFNCGACHKAHKGS
jgi:hypothetical protein